MSLLSLDVRIKFVKPLLGKVGVLLNLQDHSVGDLLHFSLSLHDLLVHYDGGHVSYHEEFVSASSNLDIDLVQSDIFWDVVKILVQKVILVVSVHWVSLLWKQLENGSFLVLHHELPYGQFFCLLESLLLEISLILYPLVDTRYSEVISQMLIKGILIICSINTNVQNVLKSSV